MHTRLALATALAALCAPAAAHAATTTYVGETTQDRGVRLVADAATGQVKRVLVGFRARCGTRAFRHAATIAPRGDTPDALRVAGRYRVRSRGGLVAVVGVALRGRRSDEVWRGRFAAKVVIRRRGAVVDRCSTPVVRWRAAAPLVALPDDPASLQPPATTVPSPPPTEPQSSPPAEEEPVQASEPVRATPREWRFTMDSEEGDYIGQGEDPAFGSPGDRVTVHSYRKALVTLSVEGANGESWSAEFDTPRAEEMVAKRYSGATRYPFNEGDEPGLSVTGEGRGCNEVTGEFTVEEIAWNPDGSLRALRLVYAHHCEGGDAALRGRLDFSGA
jgi:hypothetical protein